SSDDPRLGFASGYGKDVPCELVQIAVPVDGQAQANSVRPRGVRRPERASRLPAPLRRRRNHRQEALEAGVPMSRGALGLAVVLALAATSSGATAQTPTKQECASANESARDLRRAGKLRE